MLAGRRLFSAKGLYESRIEDITEDAGIGKGTLYLHFRNKEELVVAVVSEGLEELRGRIVDRLKGRRGLEEVTAALFAAHVGFFDESPDLMRIFHQVRGILKFDEPRWRPLRALLRMHLEHLAQKLAEGAARPCSPARLRELAVFVFGCAAGTSSVLVSVYPESARLGPWSERWSLPIARAAASVGAADAAHRRRRTSRIR